MVSDVLSFSTNGIKVFPVTVEANISRGIPDFDIIGMGDAAVKESRKRIWTAFGNQSFNFPLGKVIINLAPPSTRKEGTALDLPIAVSILGAEGIIEATALKDVVMVGELSLDGKLKAVNGILPMITEGKKNGIKRFLVPRENLREAMLCPGVNVIGSTSLRQAVTQLSDKDEGIFTGDGRKNYIPGEEYHEADFASVAGQHECKRALEVAAAGGHNIIMLGAAGCGKSMMAECLPSILPPMTFEESAQTTAVYSMAGKIERSVPLITKRPFRKVFNTVTQKGLTGGGRPLKIGEMSLAHNGVLFFDEITEAESRIIELIKEPMATGCVKISHVGISESMPANFMFVGAANPCKCGNLFEDGNKCNCNRTQIKSRIGKLSIPFLDRIDLQIIARRLPIDKMTEDIKEEPSSEIRKRVIHARKIQEERYAAYPFKCNAQMDRETIERFCRPDKEGIQLLMSASDESEFSMRSYEKILRVARTIADLNQSENILAFHIGEALQYRALDQIKRFV